MPFSAISCEWESHSSRPVDLSTRHMRRLDLRGLHTLLHPLLKRGDGVKRVRAHAAGAVLHPRHHEQSREVVGVLGAHLLLHGRVVVDRVVRLNQLIVPAVIHDQLAAPFAE